MFTPFKIGQSNQDMGLHTHAKRKKRKRYRNVVTKVEKVKRAKSSKGLKSKGAYNLRIWSSFNKLKENILQVKNPRI